MDRNKVSRFVRGLGLMLLPLACLAGLSAAFTGWAGVAALAKDHFIQLAILANLVIGVLLATLQQEESREKYGLQSYWATLIATGALLPTALAVITVIIYLAGWAGKEGKDSLLWGSTIAVWAWFVVAFAFRWLADAEHAIPSSYGELRQRLTQLKVGLEVMVPNNLRKTAAFKEVEEQGQAIENELRIPGLPWVLARGYDNVWNRLYRGEEALIEVAPEETVVAEALYDELRLQDSKIDHCDYLCAMLRQAVAVIYPGAVHYLIPAAKAMTPLAIMTASSLPEGAVKAPYKQTLLAIGGTPPYTWTVTEKLPDWLKLDQKTGVLSGTPTTPTAAKPLNFTVRVTDSASQMTEKPFTLTINSTTKTLAHPPGETEPKALARSVLRTVRRSVNEYRGERWNGLIVARNRLLATMLFTALTAYALLVIALVCNVDRGAVAAASTFYLVGATIGLLGRLRGESQTEAAVEDYGLSAARLITIPLLSGLAAIGGVVLMAMMPYASPVFAPTGPAAITQEEKSLQETPGSDATKTSTGSLVPSTQQGQSTLAPQGAPGIKSSTKTPVPSSEQEKSSSGASDSRRTKPLVLPPVPSLGKIFDLGNNLIGLLVAAVFGLTPGLLFDRLQKLTEKYKSDLKSSQATQGAQKT